MKRNWFSRWVNIYVAIGSMTYGLFSSSANSTIGQPGWYAYLGLAQDSTSPDYHHTSNVLATTNGLYSAGGAIGALCIMFVAEPFGRKLTIQISSFIALIGAVLQTATQNLGMWYAGRFIGGFAIGLLVTISPMYMSEMALPTDRGWVVGHHAIFVVLGYGLSAWVGYACYFATDTNPSFAWRFPLAIQLITPTILLGASPWVPRSPRWLLSKGHVKEAWATFQKLHITPEQDILFLKEQFYQMQEQIRIEKEKRALAGNIYTAAFTKPSYRKRMIVGFLTQFGAEMSGILVITNYQVILYTNLGIKGSTVLLLLSIYSITAWIYNPLGAWLQDKVNSRIKMYFIGTCGCIVTTTIEAALTAKFVGTGNKVGQGFAILFIYLYLAMQGTFVDTTMYLYVSEIFPYELRAIGMGFSLFGQFAATLIVVQCAPIAFDAIGWKYYLVFICWIVVFLPIIWFYFPETALLTLEEISAQFGDEVAVRVTDASGADSEQRKELAQYLENIDIFQDNTVPDAAPFRPSTDFGQKGTTETIEEKV